MQAGDRRFGDNLRIASSSREGQGGGQRKHITRA